MDEVENHAGEDIGAEPTSFEEILSIVGPDSVSAVTTTLTKRGFSKALLDSFATTVQNDEGTEFTFANLKKFTESKLDRDAINTVMVVPQPLKVEISEFDFDSEMADISIPNSSSDPSHGSHTLRIESSVYIDRSDFRTEDSEDYFGLAPGKIVGLKYAFRVRCESVETNEAGEVVLLRVVALPDSELAEDKPKGSIQWVPASTAVPIEARIYNPLFTVEEPTDAGWEAELNPESEIVNTGALVDPSLLAWNPVPEAHFQFERLGFFVVDKDSVNGKLVLNMTVNLKDSKPKEAGAPNRSRKEEQARAAAEKLAKMSIAPELMFKSQTDLYSAFDADGVPTHDAAKEPLSKSNVKKLRKEWEKQKKLYESANPSAK